MIPFKYTLNSRQEQGYRTEVRSLRRRQICRFHQWHRLRTVTPSRDSKKEILFDRFNDGGTGSGTGGAFKIAVLATSYAFKTGALATCTMWTFPSMLKPSSTGKYPCVGFNWLNACISSARTAFSLTFLIRDRMIQPAKLKGNWTYNTCWCVDWEGM